MSNKITTRDMEAVSAYLDNELSVRARGRLEARLRAEPQLQGALDELKQTRTLLRSLPQVRAPRNFTLTPEQAPRRSFSFPVFPTLQFASVLAAILLAVFVFGDLNGILIDRPVSTIAQMQAAEEALSPDSEAPAVAESLAVEAPAPKVMVEKAAGGPAEEGDASYAAEAEDVGEAFMGAEPGPQERVMGTGEVEQIPEAPSAAPTDERFGNTPSTDFLQQSEPMLTPALVEPTPPPAVETPGEPIGVPGLRLIEITLAVIALGAGITLVALRKRM